MSSISAARIGAVVRKELTEFRRNRNIVVTMGILPVVFLISPTLNILSLKSASPGAPLDKQIGVSLLFLLIIPVFVPATIASYSVIGEREQGTLEPMLSTPIRRDELLIGKAAANFIPAICVAYVMFGIFLAIVQFGTNSVVASAVWHAPQLPAEIVFIPLLAAWAGWAGLAISSRASDIRVAQQLSTLTSLPPLAVTVLMALEVIKPTFALAASLGGALLVIDCAACVFVSKLFDRERLVTGTKPGGGTARQRQLPKLLG
jgi:ABC-2 type transport system permease protein